MLFALHDRDEAGREPLRRSSARSNGRVIDAEVMVQAVFHIAAVPEISGVFNDSSPYFTSSNGLIPRFTEFPVIGTLSPVIS